MSEAIRIQGIAEIQRALFQLNRKLGEQVNRLAMRKGANFMLQQVRAAAPVKTGRLKKAIKVQNSKINFIRKNNKAGVYLVLSTGKRKNLKSAVYAQWVENGYNTGTAHTGRVKEVKIKRTRTLRSSRSSHYNTRGYMSQNGNQLRRDYRLSTHTEQVGNVTRRFGYRMAGTGKDIPGKKFLHNTFNANAPTALAIMIEASEVAMQHLATELNLNVRRR